MDKMGKQIGQVVPTSQNLRDYIERNVPEEESMINNTGICQKYDSSEISLFEILNH